MLHISPEHARRFVVERQLLARPRSIAPTADALLQLVERLGAVQFDPLASPGARNHELVLHARVNGDFRSAWETLCYGAGAERRIYEIYNKSLNFVPIDELSHHRVSWERPADGYVRKLLAKHRRQVAAIEAHLRDHGAAAPEVLDSGHRVDGFWGTKTSLTRHLLEAMFMTGKVGIARRDGNRRTYDLTHRLVPPALLQDALDTEGAHARRLLSRHRGVGLMAEGGAGELVVGTGSAADRKRRVARWVEQGALVPVRVEGLGQVRYILTSELPLLQRTAKPRRDAPALSFIAPLDTIMWDRKLLQSLFGFSYTWEVYTPEVSRKYGYYVLPMLFGDRFVGRIEPRISRADGVLTIAGSWLEDGFHADTPHFLEAFVDALRAYVRLLGVERVTFGRGKIARALRDAWLRA